MGAVIHLISAPRPVYPTILDISKCDVFLSHGSLRGSNNSSLMKAVDYDPKLQIGEFGGSQNFLPPTDRLNTFQNACIYMSLFSWNGIQNEVNGST